MPELPEVYTIVKYLEKILRERFLKAPGQMLLKSLAIRIIFKN